MLASAVALGAWPQLLVGAVLVGVLCVWLGEECRRCSLRMVRRARWLLLSIAVVYFWFTPGLAVWPLAPPALHAWLPSVDGMLLGALRAGALAVIIVAVSALRASTTQLQLLAALHSLAAPLAWFGVARERVAVRTTLTLAVVTEMGEKMNIARAGAGPWYARAGEVASSLFQGALARAEAAPCEPITIPKQRRAPLWQWLVPIALTVIMGGVGALE